MLLSNSVCFDCTLGWVGLTPCCDLCLHWEWKFSTKKSLVNLCHLVQRAMSGWHFSHCCSSVSVSLYSWVKKCCHLQICNNSHGQDDWEWMALYWLYEDVLVAYTLRWSSDVTSKSVNMSLVGQMICNVVYCSSLNAWLSEIIIYFLYSASLCPTLLNCWSLLYSFLLLCTLHYFCVLSFKFLCFRSETISLLFDQLKINCFNLIIRLII